MSCLFCGSHLLSKTPDGLACCGCGRPLPQTRLARGVRWSARKTVLLTLIAVVLLPLVGAIAANDRLRSGPSEPATERQAAAE